MIDSVVELYKGRARVKKRHYMGVLGEKWKENLTG